jgi:hypothetical protein
MYVKAAVTARAAIDWQKKKGSGPYPGFSSKKTPTDIFLWLCDINTFDFKRLAQSQGYMMVICKICKLQGIMDHDQTSHSCPGPDPGGQFGNAQPIREYDENFKMTRLLIPAQLLNSPFKGAIMSANFDVEVSVAYDGSYIPPVMLIDPLTRSIVSNLPSWTSQRSSLRLAPTKGQVTMPFYGRKYSSSRRSSIILT